MSSSCSGTRQGNAEGACISICRAPDVRVGGGVLRWRRLAAAFLVLGEFGSAGCTMPGQTLGQVVRQLESISGVVTDPSGAVVPGAMVTLLSVDDPSTAVSSTVSGPTGGYRMLARPGIYTVVVAAEGFAWSESAPIDIRALDATGPGGRPATTDHGQTIEVNVRLKIETKVERIEVPDELDRDSARSATAMVLGAREVQEMPLDPAALLDELKGLAGSLSAEIYVDGFSGTKLPPRDSIREVRINQNPFSAENDIDPLNGIVQVSSKPGTNDLHGEAYAYGNDSVLNAGNPFVRTQLPYYAYGTGGSLSGSLNPRMSYYGSVDQLSQQMNSAVSAQTLDAKLNQVAVSDAVPSPRASLIIAPRFDVRAGANGSMTFRYIFDHATQTNGGVGQLALASQGFNNETIAQTVRIASTQSFSTRVLNEARFQYVRTRVSQTPASTAPTILVEGAMTGGGNDLGRFSDRRDIYELQNYISIAGGRHYLRVGGRVRVGHDANHSEANYNGEFIFSTLSAYQITLRGIAAGDSFAQIAAKGGGASQFNLSTGVGDASVTVADAGLFVQDDWKVRANLTLSAGLRFEAQNYIADHADWAPRVGFAWGLGGRQQSGAKTAAPQYVVRGGAGVFYRRFGTDPALKVERQNGVTQQEYVVEAPQFCPGVIAGFTSLGCPGIPDVAGLTSQGASTIYRVSPSFRSPYYIGANLGLERRLGSHGTVSVTYLNNRGVHTQLVENANAPLAGTYNPANAASGIRPNGSNQNIYQYMSEGVYHSNQLSTNVSLRAQKITAYGTYVLRFDKSDAESDGGFPLNVYQLGGDYGRATSDVRHAVTVGENVRLPFGFTSWGYLRATSGAPFNIVVGQDLNGDTQYNDRPSFATDLTRPSVVTTKWGVFDTSPIAGQTIIPRNYGQGPEFFVVNFAVGKSFGVGPELNAASGSGKAKGPVARKYTVNFWVLTQNLLNHQNFLPPVGTVGSSLFGRSTGVTGGSSLSPDRVVDLQLSARF